MTHQPIPSRHASPQRATTVLFFLVAFIAFIVAHVCGRQTALESPNSMGSQAYSLIPNPGALLWMSLGYNEFVANLIWIRALQYNDLQNEAQLAEYFADAIIALDPDFEPVYRYAAVNAVFSENISAQGVERANAYLTMAAERFPTKAYYPYTIALNYMSYYPRGENYDDATLRRRAVYYLQQAMQKTDAPPQISLLISGLMNNDETSAKIRFLQQAVLTENDPNIKRHLQIRLILMTEQPGSPHTLLQARRDLWHASHHPYLPIMLDYLVSFNDTHNPTTTR